MRVQLYLGLNKNKIESRSEEMISLKEKFICCHFLLAFLDNSPKEFPIMIKKYHRKKNYAVKHRWWFFSKGKFYSFLVLNRNRLNFHNFSKKNPNNPMVLVHQFLFIFYRSLFILYELYFCVSSSLLLEKMILHIRHNCDPFDCYELH